MGTVSAAPQVSRAVATNLSAPPTAVIASSSSSRNAPVAWSETAQVLPMLTTSGASPEVMAVWMRVCRSFQPMTSRLTVMPVSSVKVSSSGVSASLSASILVPWFEAQYVSVFESPPDDDDPEQPEEAVMAARAAARLDAWTKPRRVRV